MSFPGWRAIFPNHNEQHAPDSYPNRVNTRGIALLHMGKIAFYVSKMELECSAAIRFGQLATLTAVMDIYLTHSSEHDTRSALDLGRRQPISPSHPESLSASTPSGCWACFDLPIGNARIADAWTSLFHICISPHNHDVIR